MALAVTATVTDVLCRGESTGAIELSITGGTEPYSYGVGLNKPITTNVVAGTYVYEITDANGCTTGRQSVTIDQPDEGIEVAVRVTDVLCRGESTGAIELTITGGTEPYSYGVGLNKPITTNIIAGTYVYEITDANGCATGRQSVTIEQPDEELQVTATVTNVLCRGESTGAIELSITGGTEPYSYGVGLNKPITTNVVAGTYVYEITDANGCATGRQSVTIDQPDEGIEVAVRVTDVLCRGESTGAIELTITGGTEPYSYGVGLNKPITTNIVAGTYVYEITDANGCATGRQSVTIGQPDEELQVTATVTDVLCRGESTGAIELTITGGTEPYSYGVGLNKPITTNVVAGTYVYEITDANGCTTGRQSVTIGQPDEELQVTATVTDVLCRGESTGAIELTITGGTEPYSYGVGLNKPITTNVAAGTYVYEITDANGCTTGRQSVTIGGPANPLTVSTEAVKTTICNGATNGAVNITANGGTPPYRYDWGSGSTSNSSPDNLGGGSYTVTITDGNDCETTDDFTITELPVFDANYLPSNTTSMIGTGDLTVSINTGDPNFTIEFLSGPAGATLPEDVTTSNRVVPYENLAPGAYQVRITDNNGCTRVDNPTVVARECPQINLPTPTTTDPSCFGEINGSLTVNPTGGTRPYQIIIDGARVGSPGTLTWGILSGNRDYTVRVEDANGCLSNPLTIRLKEPEELTTNPIVTNPICADDNGSINLNLSGGTLTDDPLNYTITRTRQPNGPTVTGRPDDFVPPTQDIAPGDYIFVVEDGKGCEVTTSIQTIIAPSPLVVDRVTPVKTTVCNGVADGAVIIEVSGGPRPYDYFWNNGGRSFTEEINGLAGTPEGQSYSVTVIDANDCEVVAPTFTIIERPAIGLSVTPSNTDSDFGTGDLSLTITNGTPSYRIEFTSGPTPLPDGRITADATPLFENLQPGTYTIQVTDENECTSTVDATVIARECGTITLPQPTTTATRCADNPNSSITVNPGGGTAPYQIFAGVNAPSAPPANGLTWTNPPVGTYDIYVKDAEGCESNRQEVVIITAPQPIAIDGDPEVVPANCTGGPTGSVTLNIVGGTGTKSVISRSPAPLEDENQNDVTQNLRPGNYAFTIRDELGCLFTTNPITVGGPADPLNVIITPINLTICGDNSGGEPARIRINASGGTPPYTYDLNGSVITVDAENEVVVTQGGTITVTDANMCTSVADPFAIAVNPAPTLNCETSNTNSDIGTGNLTVTVSNFTGNYTYTATSPSLTEPITSDAPQMDELFTLNNLPPGDYTVIVTTESGCVATCEREVTGRECSDITLPQPEFTDPLCTGDANGTITVVFPPDASTYTLYVNNNTVDDSNTRGGLPAGEYEVYIQDTDGCQSDIRTVTLTDPPALTIASIIPTPASCGSANDGSVAITTQGGTGVPENFTITRVNAQDQSNPTQNLGPGRYTFTVTDANGCSVTTDEVIITRPDPISVVADETDLTCNGDNSGSIELTITGGNGNYEISWSDGLGSESMVTDLAAAITYRVTITDGDCAAFEGEYTLTQPPAIAVTLNQVTPVTCAEADDAVVTFTVANAVGDLTYYLNGGTTPIDLDGTTEITGLSLGDVLLRVVDGNGCEGTGTVSLTETQDISVECRADNVSTNGGSDGEITVDINNSTESFTVVLTDGAGESTTLINQSVSATFEDLPAGIYNVEVSDENGCTWQCDETTVNEPTCDDPPIVTLVGDPMDPTCSNTSDGAITIEATGGTAPYAFNWSGPGVNPQGQLTQTGLAAGTYTVAVSDDNGCTSALTTVTLIAPDPITVTPDITNVLCAGEATGSIELTPDGESGAYTYVWSDGADAGAERMGLAAGDYTVTITSGDCSETFTDTYEITEPTTAITVSANVTNQLDCFGDRNGAATFTTEGGTGNINYELNGQPVTGNSVDTLTAGDYTVVAIDGGGCSDSETFTITGPSTGLTFTDVPTSVTTNGGSDGTISLTVSGGTAPYSYRIDGSGAAQITNDTVTISDLPAATYEIVVIDARGCSTDARDVVIAQPNCGTITLDNTTGTDPLCAGDDGSFNLVATGGTGPYTYTVNSVEAPEGVYTGPAGVYDITITDALGCPGTAQITLDDPPPFSVIFNTTGTQSVGAADGTIRLDVSNGSAPFTVTVDGVVQPDPYQDTLIVLPNLAGGQYEITVEDDNDCSQTETVTVNGIECPAINFGLLNEPISCAGADDGVLTVIAAPNTDYTYTYNGDQLTDNSRLTDLPPGIYTVVATDANGCTGTRTDTILAPPSRFELDCSSTDVTTNGGEDGTIPLTFLNGTAPYSITINGVLAPDIQTNVDTLRGLAAGTYEIIATPLSNCPDTCVAVIGEPGCIPIVNESTTRDVSCFGAADGVIVFAVSGGTPPFAISVDGVLQSSDNITGLTEGDYTITILDALNCTDTTTVNVGQPEMIMLDCGSNPITTTGGTEGALTVGISEGQAPFDIFVNGDSITTIDSRFVTLPGYGAGKYDITVRDSQDCEVECNDATIEPLTCTDLGLKAEGTGPPCAGDSTGFIVVGTDSLDFDLTYFYEGTVIEDDIVAGLPAGEDYLITASNAAGCRDTFYVTLSGPDTPFDIDCIKTDVTTSSGGNGTISLTFSGAAPPYQVTINDTSTFEVVDTTFLVENLDAGSYTIEATSGAGCVASCNREVLPFECIDITTAPSFSSPTCYEGADGLIVLNAAGGTAPLVVRLNDDIVTADTIRDLTAGEYIFAITDAVSCSFRDTVVLTQPDSLILTCEGETVQTAGGVADIKILITNGTSPFDISVNGEFLVNTSSRDTALQGFTADTYIIEITDANGCQRSCEAVVTPVACPDLDPIVTGANPTCAETSSGFIKVGADGVDNDLVYTYEGDVIPNNILADLIAGSYVIIATNPTGCRDTVTVDLEDPASFTVMGNTTDVSSESSADGTLNLTFDGTPPPYRVVINGGDTITIGVTDTTIAGLSAGPYEVVALNNVGCFASDTVQIGSPECVLITLTERVKNPGCSGGADGYIAFDLRGGTAPLTTTVNGDTVATDSVPNLVAGSYIFVVTDALNCDFTDTIELVDPIPLKVSCIPDDITLTGTDTTINITIAGGSEPFTVAHPNGLIDLTEVRTLELPGYGVGVHTVVVTSSAGCVDSCTTTINAAACPEIRLSLTASAPTCVDGTDGTIAVDGITEVGTTFTANDSVFLGNTFRMASPGQLYTIVATTSEGCVYSNTITVPQPEVPFTVVCDTTDVVGQNTTSGTISLSFTGGTGPYTISVEDETYTSQSDTTLLGFTAGDYVIDVTDTNGCVAQCTATIAVQPLECPDLGLNPVGTNPTCASDTSGFIVVGTTSAFDLTYTFSGDTIRNGILANLSAGDYQIFATNAEGCRDSITVTLIDPAAFEISCTADDVTSGTENNGTLQITFPDDATPSYSVTVSNGTTEIVTDSIVTEAAFNLTGLAAGTYTVSASNADSCVAMCSSDVLAFDCVGIDFSVQIDSVDCFGGNDGTIILSTGGGTPPLVVTVNGTPVTTNTLNNLAAGEYFFVTTDAANCTRRDTVTLVQPEELDIRCEDGIVETPNGSDGGIGIVIPNGVEPFDIFINNELIVTTSNRDAILQGFPAGTYELEVVDANGCTNTCESTVAPRNCTDLGLTIRAIGNPTCAGDGDGFLVASDTSSNELTYIFNGESFTDTLANLTAGTYQIFARDSVSNCSDSVTVTLEDPDPLNIICAAPDRIDVGSDTTITLTIVGGTAPFDVGHPNGIIEATEARTVTLPGYGVGSHDIVVTSAGGCVDNCTTVIDSIACPDLDPDLDLRATSPTCADGQDGTITINVATPAGTTFTANGTPFTNDTFTAAAPGRYTVVATTPGNCVYSDTITVLPTPTPFTIGCDTTGVNSIGAEDGTIVLDFEFGQQPYDIEVGGRMVRATQDTTLLGFAAGTYTVVVTDANGCTDTCNPTVSPADCVQLDVTVTNKPPTCASGDDGYLVVAVTGASGAVSYSTGTIEFTSDTLFNLSAGEYRVTATDANNCTGADTTVILNPDPITVTINDITPTTAGDADGSVRLIFGSGSAPYTFTLNGVAYEQSEAAATYTQLPAAEYDFIAIDAIGCTVPVAFTILSSTPECGDLNVRFEAAGPACSGDENGRFAVIPEGGLAPYTFSYDSGATFTDEDTRSELGAGVYSVIVRDDRGCELDSSVVFTQPALISIQCGADSTDLDQATGVITVTPTGGTGDFTITIDGVTVETQALAGTAYKFPGYAAGSYPVVITDQNGCTEACQSTVATRSPDADPCAIFDVAPSQSPSTCGRANGRIALNIRGGSGMRTVTWGDSDSVDEEREDLLAGGYEYTVTDDAGCSRSGSVTVEETPTFELAFDQIPGDCEAPATITAVIAPQGQYTYEWSTGETTVGVSSSRAGGFVSVTVTDVATNCVRTDSIMVEADVPIEGDPIVRPTTAVCAGGRARAVTVNVRNVDNTSGQETFTYLWNTPEKDTTAVLENRPPGVYEVRVTNQSGCSKVIQVVVEESPEIRVVESTINDVACGGLGSISILATGGTGNLSYRWSEGETSSELSGITEAGVYTVIITDELNCSITRDFTVGESQGLSVSATSSSGTCNDENPLTATVNIVGGTGAYDVLWSNGATTLEATFAEAGRYGVTVTDANDCTDTTSVEVSSISFPDVAIIDTITPASCTVGGTVRLNANAGLNYRWSLPGNPTGAVQTDLPTGDYEVTATDVNSGCERTVSIFVDIDDNVVALRLTVLGGDTECAGGKGIFARSENGNDLSYEWSNDETGDFIDSLDSGVYTVTATNSFGCSDTDSVTIVTQSQVIIGCSSPEAILVGARNGRIDLNIRGGSGPYDITYTGPSSGDDVDVPAVSTIDGLQAGDYTINVTDEIGCTAPEPCTVTIEVSDESCTTDLGQLGIDVQASATAGCDNTTGTITFAPAPEGLQFSIDGGNSFNQTGSFDGLSSGDYQPVVQYLDAGNCVIDTIAPIRIGRATQPQVTIEMDMPTGCDGRDGSITFVERAAADNLLFSIDGGATVLPQSEYRNLPRGTYDLEVRSTSTDCTFELDTTIVLAGTSSPVIERVSVTDNNSCGAADGAITITVPNALASTEYRIDNGPWQSEPTFGNLSAATYAVEVRDRVTGCTTTSDEPVMLGGRTQPPEFSVIVQDATTCSPPNGSISLDFMGADSTGLEYSFDGGLTYQEAPSIADLSPQIVTVVVRYQDDPNSCVPNITRPVDGLGILAEIDSVTTLPRSCMLNNGAIIIAGGANQRYSIDGGQTWTNDSIFTDLSDGNYTLLIGTTENECVAEYGLVRVNPTNLRIDADFTRGTDCQDSGPADIILEVSGGRGAYTYAWSDGSTDSSRYDLPQGDYTVTVLDAFDCIATDSFEVRESQRDLVLSAVPDTSACLGDTIDIDLTGLDGANEYLWLTADNQTLQGPRLRAGTAGDYILMTTTPRCTFQDTFRVDFIAPEDYVAEFSLPTYGIVDVPVAFRDISRPPARTASFIFDDPAITDVSGDSTSRVLLFDRVGEYVIGMEATSGACFDSISRVITIVETTVNLDSNAVLSTDLFQGLVLYPNPHDGDFNVKGTAMRNIDNAIFRCYDDLGRLQYETTFDIPAGLFDVDIDAADMLPTGMQSLMIVVDDTELIIRNYRAER